MAKTAINNAKDRISIKSAEQADQALQQIGELEDFIRAEESRYNEREAELKSDMVERCGLVKKTLRKWVAALKKWADVEIEAPSSKDGPRSLEMNFGWVRFRWTPPAIKFKLEEETVIERLRARGMTSCIRVTVSVDKEALAAYDDDILKAIGAYRYQEEKFYYEVKREEVK